MGIGLSALFFAVPIAGLLYLFLWLFRAFGKSRGQAYASWISQGAKESAIILGLFVVSYTGILALSFRDSGSFEKDSGSGDYWRVPLKFPFQLTMIDGLESACLSKWDPSSTSMHCIMSGISGCAVTGGRFIGKIGSGYFIYDQEWDSFISMSGIDSLKSELARQGIPFSDLRTIREFYNEYWKSH